MSIRRWDPWSEMISLRDSMDQLLREGFTRGEETGSFSMPLDVHEADDHYTVEAPLPGIKPEDVNVQIQGDTLRITAETTEEHEGKQGRWLMRERRKGTFHRSLTLPAMIQTDAVEASFDNGILRIQLPKSQEARPRSIKVRAGSGQQMIETQGQQQE